MKMNRGIVCLVLVLAMCLSGCVIEFVPASKPDNSTNSQGNNIASKPTESTEDKSIVDKVEDALLGSYEDILAEYTKKLEEATPILIEEYNEAAKNNQDGLMGLATLCNEKVSELAVISNEGIQKMAELLLYKGSGSYDEYSEWAGKLQDVYMKEAAKIQEAYMNSAT